MSSAAPASASPTVVRSHSSSRPHAHRPPSSDLPHRTRSTTTRPQSSYSQNHSSSRSQSYDRRPPSNHAPFAHIARRDFEASNLARPSTARRDSSRERSQERPPTSHRSDSTKVPQHYRTSSRNRRDSIDMPGTVVDANAANVAATAAAAQPAPGNPNQPKRRTMISTPTGQWALGKTIGAGSMGKVKIAKNIETGEQVAVKVVPRQNTEEHRSGRDAERADRSKEIRTAREAAIVSLVDHPYVCGMRDVVRTPYHWYMLFEYVNGGQMLDYIISHGKLKEKQARKFARQIASALDYCHRNSIVHRDLKIENILISKTGDIKIIDFGLSNLFSPRSHLRTFCGSLYFAAPELLQARQYTGPEVDVWSFGIVLYVLVCGKVPFDDQSMPQLHAKIKKGDVEYPQGLTSECRHIISRMLVTDPKKRASLAEIMNHPWMTKGFNGPPENYLPIREPLQLPLDPEVIERMTGFDFGPPEFITAQLTKTLDSEDYQTASKSFTREAATPNIGGDKKRGGVFDFYRRRNSASRETLSNPSVEAVQFGSDPLNAYSPLISVYFLVREKLERERAARNPGALSIPSDTVLKMPDLPAPEVAHTNQYDVPGVRDTSSRTRPRARTHGDDELVDGIKKLHVGQPASPNPNPAIVTTQVDSPIKKESTAAGILRRFSTRRVKDRGRDSGEREKLPQTVPSLNVQPPADLASPPHRGFSIRRTRRAEPSPTTLHASDSQSQQQDLFRAPGSAEQQGSRSNKFLERSASVNSADYRSRRLARKYGADGNGSHLNEPPLTSGSDNLGVEEFGGLKAGPGDSAPLQEGKPAAPRASATRAKSLGHARRESIQARRARREEAREATVPEDDDGDLSNTGNALENPNTGEDFAKPVYLKGLFSVSTTSSKPLPFIRADIIRVLRQLSVEYTEIKGGFSCRHAPSIDLDRVVDAGPPSPERQGQVSGHRRRISFGGLRGNEEAKEDTRAAHSSRFARRNQGPPDRSFISNSEASDEYGPSQDNNINAVGERVVGETTTRVQSDTGENLVLRFEIVIVKVPLFSLHGIQFKKVSGGMWQYREMAKRILDALRL